MNDIENFIKDAEQAYELPIEIETGWFWSMKDHIRTAILYKNSQYTQGSDDRPFKNIVRPILNVAYRSEGFDVKDIQIYVDDPKNSYKSFLIRKFHDKWARENELDTFIDEMVESYVDFGGALIKNVDDIRPEVVPLKSIAFCDQTDILSGPIGIKHFYSPSELLKTSEMGWGEESNGATISLEELAKLAEPSKDMNSLDGVETSTPGKYIEVYEIHGDLPRHFITQEEKYDDDEMYTNQMHIVAMYKNDKDEKTFVTLYAKEQDEIPFKLILRDEIFGRALGLGGVEELIDPQVWTNYAVIRKRDMLDSAAKTVMVTDDGTLAAKHPSGLKGVENMEIIEVADGKRLQQADTFPRNITLFDRSIDEWAGTAGQIGGANEAIMGESPKAGTPFRLQALITQESHSLHNYRKGKIATFLQMIYQEWIIPHLATEIAKEQMFMAELSFEEMQEVADRIVDNVANKRLKEAILKGELPVPEEVEAMKLTNKEIFLKSNKKFLKIFKDEMKKTALGVKINIVGKQEYLQFMVDSLVNVFNKLYRGPEDFQNPAMVGLFNKILEGSGVDVINYGAAKFAMQAQAQKATPSLEPLKVKPQEV